MSTTSDVVPFDEMQHSTMLWERLGEHVDLFLAAWQSDTPPPLAAHLPAHPPALRQLVLVELVKVDLECRWRRRIEPRELETYVAEFPELATRGLVPADLIYEEYHIRKQAGDDAPPADYLQRFPAQAEELRRLLNLESPELSTTLVGAAGEGGRVPVFEAGATVDDFDLLVPLGKGAFASVFLARQRSMQRLVALKISRDRGSEPQTLAQLDHPNIVRVFDQRQLPEQKLRLLYMQVVPGGTLHEALTRRRATPEGALRGAVLLEAIDESLERRGESAPSESSLRRRLRGASWPEAVCWLGARLASALSYAHQRGVLHRDVKPANVLLAADGTPKLADFNISFSSKLDGATPAAYFGGSLAYMSPEQLEACDPAHARQPDSLDGRSDVYSLAVLLWELLTGSRPFSEDSFSGNWSQTLGHMATMRRQGLSAPRPAGWPAGLMETLHRCLAGQPDDRFDSAAELARQLELCLHPRARRLITGQQRRAGLLRRWPVFAVIMAGVLPNALLGAMNIGYNWYEIVRHLPESLQRVFVNLQLMGVNTIAYILGIGAIFWMFGPLLSVIHRLAGKQSVSTENFPALRRRALYVGDFASAVSAFEWTVSGFVFPLWLQMHAEEALPYQHYLHFIISQVLCGLMAATLTFFFVSSVSVRVCYPWLTVADAPRPEETDLLAALARRTWFYLSLVIAVPFLAMIVLALIDSSTTSGQGAILMLALAGLIACGFALWLMLTIRTDLAALASALHPTAAVFSGDSDPNDSVWASGVR